ncbi:methyl coenzyme M reductase system, component A2 [Methanohalobium evestigatum Z-7303]|uniref:Methyl coenzyme M reductase system, component A2 n=1 Tax=Methanohalobium evestigatum (strain ATCC BAA-1072 / DSM 3721 / NBRC 107634 / OCM 161 / Z-7303) TaxID=644295 RepID=D7EBD2_METEZ|nr:methyl coenzyme M reductase system, component A2 [Methanohalobium evestigatum]ADI74649.1 methyl coenzyme M reductase system, component A2 [Methanohalobium evestigatum Z-7303]
MTLFIEIKNLTVDFDGTSVLKNVNLNINEGEVVGILGRSGAGKTVLMHVLRGVEEYKNASGEVIYHLARCSKCGYIEPPSKVGEECRECGEELQSYEVDLLKLPSNDKNRRNIVKRIAIMLQRTFALYGDDRVIDNVISSLKEIGYKGKDALSKAMELLDEVEMSHRMMHVARDLSGGEKQRVVLARQLVRNPMMLIADEPTGTLDPKTARIVHDVISDAVNSYNMTMTITSHWPDVIKQMADKAIILDKGEIVNEGNPSEMADEFTNLACSIEKECKREIGDKILQVQNLSKKYVSVTRGVIYAVNDVSFDVYEGEIFGIAGVSGAGKTTTSQILIGNVQPTKGSIEVRVGDDWVDMTVPGAENRGHATQYMGILHQEYGLYTNRTVIDNLTESIGIDLPYELAVKKAISTLTTTGFTEDEAKSLLHNMAEELSEGERHRVALAQVLMKEPNIVIMDEPTGTMDPVTKKDVTKSILKTRDKMGDTFIIVSHDMDFLVDVCDRVALMQESRIMDIGEPENVLAPLLEAEKQI